MKSPSPSSTTNCTTSPEFEFWMLRNPSLPSPNILSADELFADGLLLPLRLLSTHNKPKTRGPETLTPDPEPDSSPIITESAHTASKRWKDIFRKSDKKNAGERKKKDKKCGIGGGASTSAELNINIWPFSRSRSAGTRPKMFSGAWITRKANSAPCSRSNSAGESKSRKWGSSPGRAGVHLGRSSPVWQVRRGGSNTPEALIRKPVPERERRENWKIGSSGSGSEKARVWNLNVPIPMCRSGVSGVLINFSIFAKKTLLTSH